MRNKAWLQFISEIEKAKADIEIEDNLECFFRGHRSVSHPLLPGLFRTHKKILSKKDLLEIEGELFFEFRSRAKEIHSGNLSDWDILFYMQHHGIKTRLLDWTESLGVAIYFALLDYNRKTCKPCIWLLNPYKFNKYNDEPYGMIDPESLDMEKKGIIRSYADFISYEVKSEVIDWKNPLALYPIRRVDRLTTQGGYFTIHGKDIRPIEQIIPESENICGIL